MSNPRAKKRRDRDRAVDVVNDRHFNDCKARWEKRRRVDIYGDDLNAGDSEPPAGKHLADDLRRLHQLTGDPAFMEAGLALAAYGLAADEPGRSIKRLWKRSSPSYIYAPERVFELIRDEGLSVRAAAAQAVAELELPAASFDAAVKGLSEEYADCLKNGFHMTEENAGDVGTVFVVPIEGRDPFRFGLPRNGAEVPNNLHWRRAISRGDVTVRYSSWKKLPPNNSKT
jgi:hypothetical protein